MTEGFTIRSVRSDADVEAYVALNDAVTREGPIARRLISSRPGARREDFLVAVEDATGRIVSTTCLLPWDLALDGVPLRAAMLEMVVTDPAFRRHGLVRQQVDSFHAMASAAGADLCIIQGIPYYYRQFGYSYALDHTPTVRLAAAAVPAQEWTACLRPARPADRPLLAAAYDAEMARQLVSVRRTGADWDYVDGPAARTYDVIEVEGRAAGYVSVDIGEERVSAGESALIDPSGGRAVLAALARHGPKMISVMGSRASSLARAAEDLGAERGSPSQWLVRIPDPAAFLRRIAPVLERRMAAADMPGRDLVINLYRRALRLRMDQGRMLGVDEIGFVDASMGADGGDVCVPPEALPRLVLGYRSIEELRDAWPDLLVKPEARALLDVLFPRRESLVLMPY